MLKSLQASLEALQEQNTKLRNAIRKSVPESEYVIQAFIANVENNVKLASKDPAEALQNAQHKFIVRVNSDLDLITNLLN